ncbi:unnamed protein product [Mesocestoides corti]|uniref:Ribosomal RNA-processing protein 42 n=1 Tax=Mesocestoides corti TaxID=53468 RepID=A0A0R3UPD0_MESCO|nr:unnamed protein product [Mesocestoides corti]
MDNILLSDAERFYIIQGTQLDCRLDGRLGKDFRPMELETGVLNHTAGSARVKIGSTIVIACVSIGVGTTSTNLPNEGRMEIDVECSPTATPKFSGKSGAEIADTLKATLSAAFTRNCLPLRLLCIQPGKQCWVLHTDLLLLESDGNLVDAASLAVVAALSTIKLPVSLSQKIAAEIGDASDRGNLLPTKDLPTFITVHKIGNSYVVDANREEEACSLSRVLVAVRADGTITALIQEGCGSLQAESLMEMVKVS